MLITPHAIAGAAIGTLAASPLLVVPIAVGSHFILDSIPHWQETLAPYAPTKKTYIRIPIDIILAATLVWVAVQWQPNRTAPIVVGVVLANAPDLDVITILVPRLRQGLFEKYWDWHCKIQRETASMWGVATQLIVVFVGLCIVYVDR
jgi:Na+-transporting methylmalonyl-CoA/oxaloacetate decarboxylase beta subunit